MMFRHSIFALAATTLVAAGCTESSNEDASTAAGTGGSTTSSAAAGGETGQGGSSSTGAGGSGTGGSAPEGGWVFSMSNDAGENELIVFERAADGSLSEVASVPTGGVGSGDGLGSQGALTLSPNGEYLYVVNAGSHQISSFRIYDDHVALVDLIDSGGQRPVSLTANADRVYVVHADLGGVSGFASADGVLSPIAGAARELSMPTGAGPGQIGLTPAGDAIIVTEKATNSLSTYWVAPDGSLSEATVTPSEGMTPFGFDFSPDGTLVVSEAFGGAEGASAVSSYLIGSVEPMPISSSIPNGQTAACWLVVAEGSFVYTANTPSNTISGYELGADGTLSLFDDEGETVVFAADNNPLDLALSEGDDFLYVLNSKSDRVVGFTVGGDGALEELDGELAVPATSVGLAAR